MLRKIKRQIENEFLDVTSQSEGIVEKNIDNKKNEEITDKVKIKKKSKPKKIIVEWDSSLKNKHKTRKTIK